MHREPKQSKYDVAIIGGGMAGLSAATYLSRAGCSVFVAEQHYRAGGYAHSFRRKKYLFDSAVRIVAGVEDGGLLHSLLNQAGLAGSLPFVKLESVYTAIYPKHKFVVGASTEDLVEAYSNQFPHERNGFQHLVAHMARLYEATIRLLETDNPLSVMADKEIMTYKSVTFHELASSYLKDPHAIYAFSALWCYFGAPPSSMSAIYFSYAVMSYFKEGIYYLRGSFQKLADAFVLEIERNRGEVCLRSEVTRVHIEGKRAAGITVNNSLEIEAKVVLCASDVRKLIHSLVGSDHLTPRYVERMNKLTPSISAFEVFIGTDLPLQLSALTHETFIYKNYDYDEIYSAHKCITSPSQLKGVGISCPSLVDSSLAPVGKQTLVLTTLLPYRIEGSWRNEKEAYQTALIAMAERAIPGLTDHIDFVESGSPMTMERYTNNAEGAIYGWEQNTEQMTNRPQQRTPIPGLFLAGHWTDPGGGVVSAILSGHKVHKKVLAYLS